MMNVEFIERSIHEWAKPFRMDPFTVVPTFLTYPSNSAVMMYVEGGVGEFVVSDGGGAIGVLLAAGGHRVEGLSLLREHCQSTDFQVNRSGWLATRGAVSQDEFLGVVATLARHSQEGSHLLLRHFKPEKHSDYRQELDRELAIRFRSSVSRRGHLIGQSNKRQTFDYLLRLPGERLLAIDAVVPEASSINAALVAHMDVKAAARAEIEQMIIYDDRQRWKSSDLALLSMGAPPTAYSTLHQMLERIAA